MTDKDHHKVIPLKRNFSIEVLEELLEMAKKGEIESFIAAGVLRNKEILTAASDIKVPDQVMLSGYLQMQATRRVIDINEKGE